MFLETCGNTAIDALEACEDGNNVDGDGCSRFCLIEHGWNCPEVNDADCECYEIPCGNGQHDKGEECDDANDIDDDYCNNLCKLNGIVPSLMFSKL